MLAVVYVLLVTAEMPTLLLLTLERIIIGISGERVWRFLQENEAIFSNIYLKKLEPVFRKITCFDTLPLLMLE